MTPTVHTQAVYSKYCVVCGGGEVERELPGSSFCPTQDHFFLFAKHNPANWLPPYPCVYTAFAHEYTLRGIFAFCQRNNGPPTTFCHPTLQWLQKQCVLNRGTFASTSNLSSAANGSCVVEPVFLFVVCVFTCQIWRLTLCYQFWQMRCLFLSFAP